jgi:hypothetical protein
VKANPVKDRAQRVPKKYCAIFIWWLFEVIGQKGQKKPDGYCQAEVDPHKKRVYITSGGHVENGHQETDGDKAKDVLGDFHLVRFS